MVTRAGHSLVELIVAVTFIGASFAGLAATAVLGARWTLLAGAREEALALAGATLDSLLGTPGPPESGAFEQAGVLVAWTVEPAGAGAVVRIEARREAPAVSAELEGLWTAPRPMLVAP